MTCTRAQEFLGRKKAQATTTVDAKKIKLNSEETMKMAAQADHIYVAKGSKVVHFDMKKDRPGNDVLLSHMMGPTGNLRAPTLRVGKNILVGFQEDMYARVFDGQSASPSAAAESKTARVR